jgi:hypothetical protein
MILTGQATLGASAMSQSVNEILERFKEHLKTEYVAGHLKKVEKEQEEVKQLMNKLAQMDRRSSEFTDLVIYGLLPYHKTRVAKRVSTFPVFMNIKTFFRSYNYSEEDWNILANAVYDLCSDFQKNPQSLEAIIPRFTRQKYGRGLQCGSLTPIFFCLDDRFPIVNNIVMRTFQSISSILGKNEELSQKLDDYPSNMRKLRELVENPALDLLKRNDYLEMFCFWYQVFNKEKPPRIPVTRSTEISIKIEEINLPSFIESVNLENSSYFISPKYVRDPEFIKIALIIENSSSTNWVLPSFQRYFDWKKEDIRSFLESVFNGYYVGSFLLWDAKGEPELGVQTIKGVMKEEKEWKKDLVILDGQQRITSLFYAICAPNSPQFGDESCWRDTRIFKEHPLYFYIDFGSFLRDPKSPEIIKISNKKMSTEECFKSLLFPLYELENHGHWLAEFAKFLRSQSQKIEKIDEIREAMRKKLYYVWTEYEIPYVSLPKSMGINQVTEIFEQLNTKGKPLSVFDLLVARLFKYEIKLKDLWDETANKYPIVFRYSKAIEKIPIYILQAISLFYHESSSAKRSDILDIYRNIYAKNPDYRFENHWIEFSKYTCKALEKLENLRDGFGVKDEKQVPFESMIPVLAALLKTIDSQENKADCYKKLDKWYWASVFTNAYSQAAESQMTTDFKDVRDWFGDDSKTPKTVSNMINDLPKLNLLAIQSNWNSKYRGTMSLIALEGAKDFDTDQALENARENDKDHLFPRSFSGSHTNINSVLNMTWMSDSTNRYIKNYKKPSVYVPEFIAKKYAGDKEKFNGILRTHLVSEDALKHLLNDQFDQFLIEREKTVVAKLKKHLEIEGLENKSTLISPVTPYTNKRIFWDTLRSCQGYIHWVDKYFTKPGLELISQSSLDPEKVKEVKILMCADKADEDFRRLFKDLRDELKNKGITFEVRVITDARTKSAIHDRWILSEKLNFNVASPDVMARGQYSEILETPNKPPFDEWWNNSKDIIANWDEIRALLSNASLKGI